MAAIIGFSQLTAAARRADLPKDAAPAQPRPAPPGGDDDVVVMLGKVTVNVVVGYDASGRISEDPLTSLLTPEQRKQKDEDDALIRQLDAMRQSRKDDRREALVQKIDQIKKQLAMLRTLAAVNPQAAAKQAARLSRELAQAAKAYAAAGADAGAAAEGTASVPVDAAVPGSSETAVPDVAGPDAASGRASAEAADPAAQAERAEAEEEQAAPADGAKQSADGSVLPAEDETISEAKKLARMLKSIIEQARQEALRRRERPDAIERDEAAAKRALEDLDEAGRDLQAQAIAAAPGVQTPVAVTAVSISILV